MHNVFTGVISIYTSCKDTIQTHNFQKTVNFFRTHKSNCYACDTDINVLNVVPTLTIQKQKAIFSRDYPDLDINY